MNRLRTHLFRLSAYRVALVVGLAFTLFHARRLNGGAPESTPLIGRLEAIFHDLKFHERGARETSGDVVVAAVDERAIDAIGRWPFRRDEFARIVDELAKKKARAVVFDIAFIDRALDDADALEARIAARIGHLSPDADETSRAIDELVRARTESDSEDHPLGLALRVLTHYRDFQTHGLFARANAQNPDEALARSIHANGRVVLGSLLLDAREAADVSPDAQEAALALVRHMRLHAPVLAPEVIGRRNDDPYADGPEAPSPNVLTLAAARAPLSPFIRASADAPPAFVGFFNATADPDGVIRRTPLVLRVGDERATLLPSLDLAGLLRYAGASVDSVRLWAAHDGRDGLESIAYRPGSLSDDGWATPRTGDFKRIPVDPKGRLLINYYGPFREFPSLSLADVWSGEALEEDLEGKLVLVGVTATGTYDQRVTPFDAMVPGVATHAAALENLLHEDWLIRPWWAAPFEIGILLFIALVVGWGFTKMRVLWGAPVLVVLMAGYHAFDYGLFEAGFSVFSALPLIELLSLYVAQTLYRYSSEEREKAQIRRAFQFYLTKSVMDEMLEDPSKLKLGGDKRVLTVLFSDIRGFTSISEKLSPEQLAKFINEYLTPMTNIVFKHGGTLDKFIGDAVMAVWGAPVEQPDHALRCCRAAVEMIRELERLQADWKAKGLDYPPLDIGIGINSGPMVVGNMGADQRFDYTVLGDNVNLASRLEGTNKDYRSHIIISEATYRMVQGEVTVRELGAVRVKGRSEPVAIYELLDDAPPSGELLELATLFDEGVGLFRMGEWEEARLRFKKVLELRPGDGPSLAYLDFCAEYERTPPGENWDGVYTMAHK